MIYPFATWMPVPNFAAGATRPAQGLVLHVSEAPTASSVYNTFNNPANQVSAHFCVDVDGTIYQYVDTADEAWAQEGGNSSWLSVETVGYTTTALTSQQVVGVATVLVGTSIAEGFPLQITDDVTSQGLILHSDGGIPWGNHPDCPSPLRAAQRPDIIAEAEAMEAPNMLTAEDIQNVAAAVQTMMRYEFVPTAELYGRVEQAVLAALGEYGTAKQSAVTPPAAKG